MTNQDTAFNPNQYWEERLQNENNLQGVGFLSLGKAFNKWMYKVRKYSFVLNIQRCNVPVAGKKTIDIGSGTGFWIEALHQLNAGTITGVDLTEVSVKTLSDKFPYAKFVQADIGEQQLPPAIEAGSYDVLTCLDVLFHIVDDNRFEQAVANIGKILKPGGYFIYSDLFLNNGRTIRGRHQVMHSEEFLLGLFEKHGFEVVKRTPFMYLSNTTVNSNNVFIKTYWWLIHTVVRYFKFTGHILGPLTYWLDKYFVRTRSNSPTIQLAILRKK